MDIPNRNILSRAEVVVQKLRHLLGDGEISVYGIPRGGVCAVYAMMSFDSKIRIVSTPDNAEAIVDDLVDSGNTRQRYQENFPQKPFLALLDKESEGITEWVSFPWEATEEMGASDIPTRLLQYIGENPKRGGLLETPRRFLKAWKDWTIGYTQKPEEVLKVFEDGAEGCDQMILVKDIPVYSQCEHHLAPFFGVAHVSYIPDGKIVGLSKLSRLVDVFAKRLQVQERLTNQIADALVSNLAPKGVGVVIECRHLCMESRGIQRIGATTITSAMRGAMLNEPEARAELMNLIK